jgi:DNA phosphorothioation-dependent restriction protein DptH
MKTLVDTLAGVVREKAQDAVRGTDTKLEARFIFHGPPLDIMEAIFDVLVLEGGIHVPVGAEGGHATLPVLLQLPRLQVGGSNPRLGESGKCDDSHLLHIRNDPNGASFVALMPPGQHSNRSVTSTTAEFGVSATSDTGHATFDEWWADSFVQTIALGGLYRLGLGANETDEAMSLLLRAGLAVDAVDPEVGSRTAAWHMLARLYSSGPIVQSMTPGTVLALACGMPRMQDGGTDSKVQVGVLAGIAEELANGFQAGIDGLIAGAGNEETKDALRSFLAHVRTTCQVPTTFQRGTAAYYLPSSASELGPVPGWWTTLTAECWMELLSEEPAEESEDLAFSCTNPVIPVGRGMPAIVRAGADFTISSTPDPAGGAMEVTFTGGSAGKAGISLMVAGTKTYVDIPPKVGQRTTINYKVSALGRKAATTKVISLASWLPGLLVTCRIANKLAPPKKPRRGSPGVTWETSLSLPGSGRYELLLLASPAVTIIAVTGVADDSTEQSVDDRQNLVVHALPSGDSQVEVEVDGKYQLDVTFKVTGESDKQLCRAYITCDETREEGCKSEFERLIKLNRKHLEKFDAKSVIQLDRHARLSSLQAWILDEQNIERSFIPVIISDDYSSCWSSPDWLAQSGPILSQGRFLHDPRPQASLFQPPAGFLEARAKIAARVRETSDNAGLLESAPLGLWFARDDDFRLQVESYLDAYAAWLVADRDVACWVDVIAVCPRESGGRTLARVPDAILLSPLHPVRLAWHCLAQQALYNEVLGDTPHPCPAASILDPDCVPDLLTIALQSPGGPTGIEQVNFLSVECSSDYWSVLWNGGRLGEVATNSRRAPFDNELGLVVGGISSGFSPAQVGRALDDVSDILSAKPIMSVVVASAGGASDACNEGLTTWSAKRFSDGGKGNARRGVGPRFLEVFDTRHENSRPDQATIANLSEDTSNSVRWYDRQPTGTSPDLGILAQLDSAEAECTDVGMRSPLGPGGLLRHRVRRQLQGAFLSESRQGQLMPPSSDIFADKVAACIVALESGTDAPAGLRFAPNVHAIADMLNQKMAGLVAVSSSAIDPACFLGGWIKGTYLWDYDLPSYSQRAGDTSGYYLISQVKEADRDALGRALRELPGCKALDQGLVENILLEVSRRGIPTVRGLSGDDTGATGDLGLFLAVRLLQDQFRLSGNVESLLPVLSGTTDNAAISIIVPVDPFRGYLADLARSLGNDRKDTNLSRPDLLVVCIELSESAVRMHLTPIEVKCRQKETTLSASDAKDALAQARAMSTLLEGIRKRAATSTLWDLAFKHLVLSMVGFGLRVYSLQEGVSQQGMAWAEIHQRVAAAILGPCPDISIDGAGRLMIVDGATSSGAKDHDGDGFEETIVISQSDAGMIVAGDAQHFYEGVRAKVGTWQLLPPAGQVNSPGEAIPETVIPSAGETPDIIHGSAGDNEHATASGSEPASPNGAGPGAIPAASLDEGESKGITLLVGQTVDGFQPRPMSLNISDTRLNQLNIGVVGDLGTGKTQFLKSLIYQIVSAGDNNRGVKPRFLIFDYKRDYSNPEFVAATGAKVIRPRHLPLNLFDTTAIGDSMSPWLDRFRFFTDVLDKVYTGIGPVQRDKLKSAVRNAYDACVGKRQPTIYDIHSEYRTLLAGKSDSPMAIIDDLVDMEIFEKDPAKTTTFDKFLDGVVVISLDAMGQDDRSKNMLVAIMLNMFYENMLQTPKRPFIGQDPQLRVVDSYLLVDEADNIMRYDFDVLRKLLLQGREFGAGVILASQYLRHFKTAATDYREPLLTWFIHKVPNISAAELGALGLTSDLGEVAERVKKLANHHCLYKSIDCPGELIRGLPFFELSRKE